MTYKSLYSKLNKAITNLSASVELEEAFYIQDDVKTLNEILQSIETKNKSQTKVVSMKDYPYKEKCLNLVDEANFYLEEAREFFNS